MLGEQVGSAASHWLPAAVGIQAEHSNETESSCQTFELQFAFPSGFIAGGAVVKKTRSLVVKQLPTAQSKRVTTIFHLVHNRDVKAERNWVSLHVADRFRARWQIKLQSDRDVRREPNQTKKASLF